MKILRNRKSVFGIIISLVIVFAITPAFALSGAKTMTIYYNNIKLLIDGKEFTPKDPNGNVVEPFTFNGTTYVPLRAVAEAFGKDVGWDSVTATVTIGGKSFTYLDSLSIYSQTNTTDESFIKSVGEMSRGKEKYKRGVRIFADANEDILDKGDVEVNTYSYLINKEYKTFFSYLYIDRDAGDFRPSILKVFGDNNLLYTSPPLTGDSTTYEIEADVSNVNVLTIEISSELGSDGNDNNRYINLADARLVK